MDDSKISDDFRRLLTQINSLAHQRNKIEQRYATIKGSAGRYMESRRVKDYLDYLEAVTSNEIRGIDDELHLRSEAYVEAVVRAHAEAPDVVEACLAPLTEAQTGNMPPHLWEDAKQGT